MHNKKLKLSRNIIFDRFHFISDEKHIKQPSLLGICAFEEKKTKKKIPEKTEKIVEIPIFCSHSSSSCVLVVFLEKNSKKRRNTIFCFYICVTKNGPIICFLLSDEASLRCNTFASYVCSSTFSCLFYLSYSNISMQHLVKELLTKRVKEITNSWFSTLHWLPFRKKTNREESIQQKLSFFAFRVIVVYIRERERLSIFVFNEKKISFVLFC